MNDMMQGKTVLVTGATDGIGLVTARALAGMGARVLLAGRNEQKGQRALAAIRQAVPGADLSFWRADLSHLAEVRRLSQRLSEAEPHIDVLVNNAGGIFAHRLESADGIEMTFALNHLSYFLLTWELLDLLRAAPAARSSQAHGLRTSNLDFRASFSSQ